MGFLPLSGWPSIRAIDRCAKTAPLSQRVVACNEALKRRATHERDAAPVAQLLAAHAVAPCNAIAAHDIKTVAMLETGMAMGFTHAHLH